MTKDAQPEFTEFTVSPNYYGSYYIVIDKLEDIVFHRESSIIGTNYPMKLLTLFVQNKYLSS